MLVLHTIIKLLLSEPHREIKEEAPRILALLLRGNEGLQRAAVDAGKNSQKSALVNSVNFRKLADF
jgi:hypothetical protein